MEEEAVHNPVVFGCFQGAHSSKLRMLFMGEQSRLPIEMRLKTYDARSGTATSFLRRQWTEIATHSS